MLRTIASIGLIAILVSSGFPGRPPECQAQNRTAPADYDYYSLAVTSILDSAADASKLPDISQSVKLLISAANILPASHRDEALRLLDVSLGYLKEWDSEKASWRQRDAAATLRNEVLAVYSKLDPEKATALQKEFQLEKKSAASRTDATSLKPGAWFSHFSSQQTTAEHSAKIAFSIVDRDPDKALALVRQSLQGGTVSSVLLDLLQKLLQNNDPALLNKLELSIAQALAGNVTLDPYSLTYAALLVRADKEMPAVAKSGIVSFLMHSVQAWAIVVKEPEIDASYISRSFFAFSKTVRPIISSLSPDELIVFDFALRQVEPLIPEKMRPVVSALQPEMFSDPRDRLNDILKDPAPAKRDSRLTRLLADLLRNKSEDLEINFDLASDAIAGFSDPDGKSAYTDLLTITRIDRFVKQKKFIEAQQLAGSISSDETRAWTLLALSSVAAKSDRVLGFELVSNALKALDKASPSPHKVQLALNAAAMLSKDDSQRAFDTLSTAAKYANSSAAKVDPPAKPPFAFGLEARIGETHTRLGVFPESLAELEIDRSLSVLATTDWFRAEQIVDNIREPSLRLQLKLLFAGAVLTQASKRN